MGAPSPSTPSWSQMSRPRPLGRPPSPLRLGSCWPGLGRQPGQVARRAQAESQQRRQPAPTQQRDNIISCTNQQQVVTILRQHWSPARPVWVWSGSGPGSRGQSAARARGRWGRGWWSPWGGARVIWRAARGGVWPTSPTGAASPWSASTTRTRSCTPAPAESSSPSSRTGWVPGRDCDPVIWPPECRHLSQRGTKSKCCDQRVVFVGSLCSLVVLTHGLQVTDSG